MAPWTRSRCTVLAAAVVALVAGCTATAGRADVSGVVAGDGERASLADASDPYYEGLWLGQGDPVVTRDGGRTVADLRDGDRIDVWLDGGCAESYPVQCDVGVIQVTG